MRSRRTSRRVRGLFPRLWDGLRRASGWALRHPQPLLVAGAVGLVAWALWGYAQRTDAFRIAHVHVPPHSSLSVPRSVVGANLWRLHLQALAGELKRQQPWLKDVRVVRQLPDGIRIDAIPRVPAAQVRLDRWYPVDRDGFILPDGTAGPEERLVRLTGFDRAGIALKAGQENRDERLRLALRILQAVRRSSAFLARRLTEVNVADPAALRLVLDEETEIRCGSEAELEGHLARLRATLRAIAKQQLAVRYIDLRFQEPVVAPRS